PAGKLPPTQTSAPARKPEPAYDAPKALVDKLLGKRGSPPKAPVGRLEHPRNPAPEAPAGKTELTYDAPKALVDKLLRKQDSALDTPVGPPLITPDSVLETPVGPPIVTQDSVLATPVASPPSTQDSAPQTPVGELPRAENPALETPTARLQPTQDIAPERPVGTPPPVPSSAPERPASKPLSAQPAAKLPSIEAPAPERPIDKLQHVQDFAREQPVSTPQSKQDFAPGTAIGKLLPAQPSVPEKPAGKLLPVPEKLAGKMLALPRRTRDEREFLPAALEIVDTPPSPVGRAVGLTIIALAVIAIAWACIGKVDIVATATGRIVPAGKVKILQPADTGIVTAIHVADGDHVKAGDPLIELNSNQALADRDRFARDLLQAQLNLARLHGLAATLPGTEGEGRVPKLADPPKNAAPEDVALTLAAMRAQAANERAKLADLDQQIEAKQAEAAEAQASVQKLQASLPMLADQEKLLRDMRDQKIGSKLDWYQVNQQLIEQQHEIGVLAHRKDAAAAAQRALREQRMAEAAQYQMSVLADLDKTRAQASELEAELSKSQQRLSQVLLTSPIDGTVQQLAIHTIGGVVTPAESLLAIVPADDRLVVEAAVQNRDVGFISAGQTVRIKVEAFNFTLYGLIDGKVLDVTRDAVSNPNNDKKNKAGDQNDGDNVAGDGNSGPVYLARIALSQDWMMTENGKIKLTPGMAVTAEIQTGERRLISYLLSPLVRHVSESMHER
ncbi:MAG TPA: HlyD family type I secretion periplasmic adaptor subunit, partial [Dongiaceae bacterium]|nr:HlyD family type I secretion periplasmic adaptor subunit [Dongiaceae bacterium]